MNTKAVVLLFTVLCAALCRAQEVRLIYEWDLEENNGTQYTPTYDGGT